MKDAASFNLKDYKSEIFNLENIDTTDNDILIATFWESVYFIKNLKGYKMYFVQDYEPYFYEYGEDYILSENTYKLGLHVVSLGKWNIEKIKKLTDYKNTILDYIDFPYEKKEYVKISRNYNTYKEIKKIKLCVYVKAALKRAPYLIDTMLGHLKLKLKNEKGINLEITYFGNESYLKLENGQSLGKLDKKSLMELYHNSDFGMCASLTNISLVPYEMLATGLPLIEFEEGSFKDFFPEETAIITDFNYETLYRKLLMVLSEPEILEQKNNIAFKIMKDLSWDNSGRQFVDIIKKKVLK
jgi:glycosyltransferase